MQTAAGKDSGWKLVALPLLGLVLPEDTPCKRSLLLSRHGRVRPGMVQVVASQDVFFLGGRARAKRRSTRRHSSSPSLRTWIAV
jgi:hypothetical protein